MGEEDSVFQQGKETWNVVNQVMTYSLHQTPAPKSKMPQNFKFCLTKLFFKIQAHEILMYMFYVQILHSQNLTLALESHSDILQIMRYLSLVKNAVNTTLNYVFFSLVLFITVILILFILKAKRLREKDFCMNKRARKIQTRITEKSPVRQFTVTNLQQPGQTRLQPGAKISILILRVGGRDLYS